MTASSTPRLGLLALSLLHACAAMAADDTPTLREVVVKGQGMSAQNETVSTTRIDQEQIREQRVSRVQELFTLVPGMENRGLQIGGVADSITLRGFTGGGHGGDLGAVIDGVPLNEPTSHADGYVDFNVLIPLELSQMAVHRGPVSVLYGNYARAGVVGLESRKGGNYREADVSLGSFGTLDTQVAYGLETEGRRINLAAQGWRTDGARDNSKWHRGTLAGRVAYDLTPDVELAFSGRYHSGKWDATGRITQAELDNKSLAQKAHPQAQNDGGEKEYLSLRADLGVKLNDRIKLLAFAYGVDQSFLRFSSFAPNTYPNPVGVPWPQREESYDRSVSGAGLNLNGRHELAGATLDWVTGLERYTDTTDSRYRAGLLDRMPTVSTTDGSQRLGNRQMRMNTTSYFAQGEWSLDPLFRPSVGVRHDRFTGDCRVLGTEFQMGGCGTMNSYSHTSPKLGVRSTVAPGVDLRTSWTEGFQLPNDAAKYVPGGAAVEPTTFRQFELGANTKLGQNAVLDIAWFRIDSSDEIYLANAATATYANLGQTRREGIEIDWRYAPAAAWELHAVGSWFNSKVMQTSSAAAPGKKVPSTPNHMFTLGATWRPVAGWSATTSVRKVGSYAVDAANLYTYKGYTVAKVGVQYERASASGQRQRYYASIDNVFDRRYGASAGVTNGTWFYAPGAPRTLTAGVQFDF